MNDAQIERLHALIKAYGEARALEYYVYDAGEYYAGDYAEVSRIADTARANLDAFMDEVRR